MVSLCNLGFLPLLLLLTAATALNSNSDTAARQGKKRPTWIQYIDAMYAVCISISQEDTRISMKLMTLLHCINAQREYLQCISSLHLSDKFLAISRTFSGLQTPCGLIHLSNQTEASFATRKWTITVHSQLFLNLTFLEFVFPMPYGRCDRSLGSEYLVIKHETYSLDLSWKDAVFLCGSHSPFSMVWRGSRVQIVYRRAPSLTQIAHFRIEYQVCDQRVRTPKAHIIHSAPGLQSAKFSMLTLNKLPFFESGPKHVMYTIHLLGNRLRLLDMMFVLADTNKTYFSVDAFDGPGQDELHRRPIEHQVLDSEWIYFLTFQGYLHITCEKYHCGGIFIKYGWSFALRSARRVTLSHDSDFATKDFTGLCSRGNHWYCVFSIAARNKRNVEISLQEVKFYGPDYLGGLNEPYNCLLAGVTIADQYRTTLMSRPDYYFKDLGDVPRDLAFDSVLPEITTCRDVPLAIGDRVVQGFPIDTFVSYGQSLVLLIYAYGAYIDLSKSEIKLVMRPSHSAGLIVSCLSIPADGYLGSWVSEYSTKAANQKFSRRKCPMRNILHVRLSSLVIDDGSALHSEVIICTGLRLGKLLTMIVVLPYLSHQVGSEVVRSLFVQKNPYASDMEMPCHIRVEDRILESLNYDLSIKAPVTVNFTHAVAQAKRLTSGTPYIRSIKQLTDQYLTLDIYTKSPYASAEINASLPCPAAVPLQLSEETDKIFERRLQQAADLADCRNYLIPLWNNGKNDTNNIHLLPLPKLRFMKDFDLAIKTKSKMGKLTALVFNLDIGDMLFIVKIRLHGKCAQHCSRIRLQVVYRALVSHDVVSLQWNFVLNASGFQAALSDIPMSGVLLYITSLNDNCTQIACSAKIDIQHSSKQDHVLSVWNGSASDQTAFVEYRLLWSHGKYTWDEAEKICQELDGMHLASISSEKEYLLITRMLLGGVYRVLDTDEHYLPILTPCWMGSPLCVIHIGLRRQVRSTNSIPSTVCYFMQDAYQVIDYSTAGNYTCTFQNARFSWSDGRPTGFFRWNRHYFRGAGPDSVTHYSQGNVIENFTQLLTEARSILQPQYTNETLCTVLMGSPGPQDMEFVSVPCDRKLKVSGIMCVRGGNKLGKLRPLYRLTHLKLQAKNSQLVTNTIDSYFNIDTWYTALLKNKPPSENQATSELPAYYEASLTKEAYSERYSLKSQNVRHAWTENIYSCNKSSHDIDLCDLLWSYNESRTHNTQHLTTDLFITTLDQNFQNASLSIWMSNNTMFASTYCKQGAVFDGKQCIRLLQIPSGSTSTLDKLCQRSSSDSHAYVYSVNGDLRTLTSILYKLDKVSGQASCLDVLGNTVVLLYNSGNIQARVYDEVDPPSKYVVCSSQPAQPTCPPSYVRCNSGCISEQLVCDGKVDCGKGEDEQNCTHLCDAVNTPPNYCQTKCHRGNCTCHELYFQCSSGGCIHSSKLCDGHANCINGEDESACFSLMPTPRTGDTRNDFIPDEENSSDEEIYVTVLRSVGEAGVDTCSDVLQVPCLKGHPACYSIHQRCLYDHTEDGRLKYCGNGLHLLECEYFQCSGSFKCQHSYCVPTYKVCNGVQDCPYGDDEFACPVLACSNMLRCSQTCVHPSEICDGSIQCEFGEDELACGAPDCPATCQCSGYAMKCHTFIMLDASFKRLTMFILRLSKLVLAKQIFQHVTSLLILDISYCRVTSISSDGPFVDLSALFKLDLSHNAISSLAHGSLDGLTNLVELDISWNPLKHFELQVFAHMGSLRALFLHHCQLRAVSDIALPNTQTLDILDMSSGGVIDLGCLFVRVAVFNLTKTIIHVHGDYSQRCWKNISRIVSDQTGLCCLGFVKDRCDAGWEIERGTCQSLLLSQTFLFYCCVLTLVIATCNCCVFAYKFVTKSRDAMLLCNLSLANFIIVVPIYIFVNWHISHGSEFPFFEPLLSRSVRCRVSGDILVVCTQLATFFQMLISLQKYCGIARRHNILSETKPLAYLVTIAAWVTSALACIFIRFQDIDDKQTTTVLEGLFHYYVYNNLMWPAFSVLNIIFVLVSLFAYGLVLKKIHETRFISTGRKHGKDSSLSSSRRVKCIMVLSNVSVLATICLIAWLSLARREWSQTLVVIVLMFPLQSVFNPFLFTLSTERFVKDCRGCFHL